VDIDGGEVDGITLGTNSAVTEAQIDNIKIDGNAITSTNENGNIDLTPAGTGEVNISKVDIDSGAIDGATIATSDVTVGSGKTLDVSAGTLTSSTAQKQAIVDGATIAGLPSGMISPFAMAAAPTGWLLCDGTRVSTTTYAALVTAIYVGDTLNSHTSYEWGQKWDAATSGSRSTSGTYLSLPDLRGTFLRGTGNNATHTRADGVAFGGPNLSGFQNDKMQGHQHNVLMNIGTGRAANAESSNTTYLAGEASTTAYMFRTDQNSGDGNTAMITSPVTDGTNGTPRTGTETHPFAASVNFCIKF
jgi:microcystin-dependent protein